MEANQPKRETLAFTDPNKARVIKELDALIAEWRAWQEEVAQIKDQPYDRQMQNAVYADQGCSTLYTTDRRG
jgi:transposase